MSDTDLELHLQSARVDDRAWIRNEMHKLTAERDACRKKAQVLVEALKKMREFNCGCADIPPRVIADKALEEWEES